MMRLALFLLSAVGVQAQIPTATALLDSLAATAALADASARDQALDAIWSDLSATGRVPFVAGDSAVWLWRGSAGRAAVAGDHTGWEPAGARRFGTVWARAERLDPASRIDYKWVVDGEWVLDPANPLRQWSGHGPNSELRMPGWRLPAEAVRGEDVAGGTLSAPRSIASARYGKTVTYRVWTPADYDGLSALPTVYVTDGHEYADDRLGAMPTVLDNLVAQERIEPPVVVFIDPRVGGDNLRQEQYVQNPGFAAFVADELVPAIDAAYRTRPDRDSRVILGTSLGGLFSAYLGVQHPDVFGRLAIHSPAFWASEGSSWAGTWSGPSIYRRMAESPATFSIAMSTGTVHDTQDGARRMRDVIGRRDDALFYDEVPEGHSWGNWRGTLDDLLTALLPPGGDTGPLRLAAQADASGETVTLRTFGAKGPVRFECADADGRAVWSGRGVWASVPVAQFDAGVYRCTAWSGDERASQSVTISE